MIAITNRLKPWFLISALVGLTLIAVVLILVLSGDPIVSVILIALILLLWPIGFLVRPYLQRSAAPESSPPQSEQDAPQPDRPSRTYPHLESGAAETVDFLRRNRRGAAPGGDAIYGLPWFLIVGPPASGKTSLMLSAGLPFTPLQSQRQVDLDLLRPTGNCEWRITDDAVLIDSAGRYQTEGADRDEWLGLIEILKRYRRQRPLDGLVIAVNGAGLLAMQTSAEVEQQARILRARLNELTSGLGIQFPIYLVLTHADKVPGFGDFFGGLAAADRSGVWGAMIPLANKDRAHALFDTEFDQLFDSLLSRRLPRLDAADTPGEQLGAFDFPLLFNTARQRFGVFITALFSPNPFSRLPLLRGIYLTGSAPKLPPPPRQTGDSSILEVHIRSKGLFTEGLFRQVLRGDRHVAAALQVMHGRPHRIRRLAISAAALGALSLLLLIGMSVSYFNNRRLIADGQRAGADLLRHFKPAGGGLAAPLTPIEAEDLGRLQDLLIELDDYERGWLSPISRRLGLYTGNRLRPRLREIYFDFVSQRLLASGLDALAQDLNQKTPAQAAGEQPEQLDAAEQGYYDRLRAYLMVEQQERVEPVFLQQQLAAFWREGPSSTETRHLYYYAEQAGRSDDGDPRVPRPVADRAVVTEAREKLRNYAAAKQIYNEIIDDIARQGEPYRLREAVGGQQGSQWFEEIGSLSVPYTFTKEAYYRHVKGEAWLAAFEEVRRKSQNDWVLQRPFDYQRVQPQALRQAYERDYLTAWQRFLEGIRIKAFQKKSDAVEALDLFSQPNSPFAAVFDQVRLQTTLSEPPITGGVIAWLKSWLTSKEGAGTEVEKSFAAVKSFKLEAYLEKLKEVGQRLNEKSGDEWRQVAALAEDPGYKKARDEARGLLRSLKANPGGGSMAALLGRPLDNVESALGRGVEKDRDAAWNALYNAARGLEERYPFKSGSSTEIQPADLADYLGRLTQFFDQYLKNSFDRTPGPYTPLRKEDFSEEFVIYLNQMFRLRDALAIRAPGGQPAFRYSLALQPPPGQTVEMRIDGQTVKAESGLQTASLNWPSSGQISGVEIGTLDKGQFRRSRNYYGGAWGLFRMVAERSGGSPPYQINLDGVRVTIQPPSAGNNPFIDFARLRAPRSIGR
ncbi:MAG TPA: type VI secretion system membrane subunit TssM [Blastocatellia bacterium]|nr:type VI secretion system membrane subunit TssM [Blastocatellia bacterium]